MKYTFSYTIETTNETEAWETFIHTLLECLSKNSYDIFSLREEEGGNNER